MVKCACVDFGSNSFMTKTEPFPMDGHYSTNIINGVSHSRSDSVVPLVLYTVVVQWLGHQRCAMAGAPALYDKSLRIASTLLRRGNILGRPYY